MKLKGAQIIVETLIEQGASTVFGYPGGQVIDIYDALYLAQDRIHHIITAHEQGAAHAADGYARATGEVGVVIATSGPGATNLVTGIATAYLDSVPLVAITGNVGTSLIGRDSFQEVYIAGITMPITKHNFVVRDVEELADTVRDAFRIAASGRPGPVLIDIPKDITAAKCEFIPKGKVEINETYEISDEELQTVADMIAASERPMIYYGGGVETSDAGDMLLQLQRKADIPSAHTMMAIGCIPAAAIGLTLDDFFNEYFYNAWTVAIALIVYGVVFILLERRNRRREAAYLASRAPRRPRGAHARPVPEVGPGDDGDDAEMALFRVRTVDEIDWKTSLKIGCFQMLAIIPGTSRSGSTIIGGMLCGCSRTAAAEFTFFLAIPVMFGWGVLKLIKYLMAVGLVMTATEIAVLVVGIVTAFVVSVISIKFLMGYIKKNDFTAFGVYRIIVGLVVLAYFGVKVLL